jgi:hypothetical protein
VQQSHTNFTASQPHHNRFTIPQTADSHLFFTEGFLNEGVEIRYEGTVVMLKKYRGYLVLFVMLATVLIGVLGANFVFAHGQANSPESSANIATSAEPVTSSLVHMHTIDMRHAPAVKARPSSNAVRRKRPLLTIDSFRSLTTHEDEQNRVYAPYQVNVLSPC